MVVAPVLSVVTQRSQSIGDLGVVGDDRPGLAVGTEVLAGIETEAATESQGSGTLSVVSGTMGLRPVLDHRNTMPPTDFQERRHVRRLSVEVDGQDRLGPGSDALFDLEHIHCIGDGVHVDEDRGRSDIADRP